MGHLPVHDIARIAADERRDTRSLLFDRLKPGGGFMWYSPANLIIRHLLQGDCTLEEATRWIHSMDVEEYIKNNYLAVVKLVAKWADGRSGSFVPLPNRQLAFAKQQTCPVHISGLWINKDGPMLLWFFPRKIEALLGTYEFGFSARAIRKVFPERELIEAPVSCIDLSAKDKSSPRVLREYKDHDLPDWTDREMDLVFQRYLEARKEIEPAIAQLRRDRPKRRKDSAQRELF